MPGKSSPKASAGEVTDHYHEFPLRSTVDPCSQRTLQSLRRIMRAVDLHSRRLAVRYNVTGPQLACLRAIHGQGSMTSAQLAREVYLSPSTIVGILDRLEEKGWITRRRSSQDRRLIDVSVTVAGAELLGTISSPLTENLSSALGRLPESEQAAINLALDKLISLIEIEPDMSFEEDPLAPVDQQQTG